jgi:hypothetical protein
MKTKSLVIAAGALALVALPSALADDVAGKIKRLDNNGDGRVTQEEHAEVARTSFGKLDSNSDGVLNADEISSAKEKKHSKLKFWAKDDDGEHAKLSECDQNNDGQITRAEYEASKEAMFTSLDANHDGALTEQELDAKGSATSDYKASPRSESVPATQDTRK